MLLRPACPPFVPGLLPNGIAREAVRSSSPSTDLDPLRCFQLEVPINSSVS